MLVDHRDQLSNQRVASVNRLQRLLAELTPGQAKKDITALQAKAILASVRPRDVVGKTRRHIAADELANLMTIEKKVRALTVEIKAIVTERRDSHLMDLPGVGPVVAARILADVGDVARFADRNRFASWTGTAPIDASSGEHTRHRLSRAGNRRMNRMLHIAATTQIRLDTEGRAYYRRKLAAGKTRMEAMRCLKRRISDAVYRQLLADAQSMDIDESAMTADTGPGGHCGASLTSSAVDLTPDVDTSDPTSRTRESDATTVPPTPEGRRPQGRLTTEGSRNDATAHRLDPAATIAAWSMLRGRPERCSSPRPAIPLA
jgi:hypothetical protein